jgi:hypothetical protein
MNDIFVQAIGLVAFAIGVFSFTRQNDTHLRLFLGLSALTLSVHFYFLGALFGAMGAAVAGTRMLVSIHPKGNYLLPVFLSFYVYLLWINDSGYSEYLPIIAGITGTLSTFLLTHIPMRFGFLAGQVLWFSYSVIHFSIGGMMLEIMNAAANIRTIMQMRKNTNKP